MKFLYATLYYVICSFSPIQAQCDCLPGKCLCSATGAYCGKEGCYVAVSGPVSLVDDKAPQARKPRGDGVYACPTGGWMLKATKDEGGPDWTWDATREVWFRTVPTPTAPADYSVQDASSACASGSCSGGGTTGRRGPFSGRMR